MASAGLVTKRRYLWRPSALRLLREQAWTRYATQAIPRTVDGVQIELADAVVSFGLQVTVRSRRLMGQDLFSMLYDRNARDVVLDMGLVALKALLAADVGSPPFSFFTMAYDLFRCLKIMSTEMLAPVPLSDTQKVRLRGLLAGYVGNGDRNTLIHGDLHPSHLIVNRSQRSLGLIDLEAMRIGKGVTNFAQLWEAYYHADPLLAKCFYQRYLDECSGPFDAGSDADARAEIALRCHSHIQVGRRSGRQEMVSKAYHLLTRVLSGDSFEHICLGAP